ncbi:gamma-tubulin complex component 5-like [Pollicipes pollicipes]|uniref:gamma-tubulin complex component 5-like n=1 Tax=Pollicipes pollicipes TaxID=41117 RepID=UPI001884D8E8|nr:gamma-tubulin complex component 5-like [Pollicipes pollicipes]
MNKPVDEDQENFDLCRRYVLSNIYYHRYLDTSSHQVRRQLEGVATKLRVHALPDQADRLERLGQRLVQQDDWAEHAQWDIEWRLLSLLINLSNNPTSLAAGGVPRAAAATTRPALQEQEEEELDWAEELRVEEDVLSPYQSPDPLAWLERRVALSYQPAGSELDPLRPTPDAAETFQTYQLRLGLCAPGDCTLISEWSVCRELVWQLLRPTDSPLFQLRNGQFTASSRYRRAGPDQDGGPLATHRAFAASLAAHLAGLDSRLLALERQLIRQEVTLTLRGIQVRLADWTSHVAELDRLLQRGVLDMSPDCPRWARTARLVSVLYEAVQLCSDERWSSALLKLLLDSLQPLLAIVDAWTVSETEPDAGGEFLIERNDDIAVTDAHFWSRGFTVHSSFEDFWTDGVQPLPFLLPHLGHIVQIAKCLRVLCHLKLTSLIDDSSLQDEFIRLIGEALPAASAALPPLHADVSPSVAAVPPAPGAEDTNSVRSVDSGRGSAADARSPPRLLPALLEAYGSPHLTAAFGDVMKTLTGEDDHEAKPTRAAPAARLTTAVPHVLCSALGPPVSARLAAVCRRLVTTLRTEYRLDEHLRMLRRVFLMEAGDLMAAFSRRLFETLEVASTRDESVSLTLCLEDCLSARHADMAARFSVTLVGPEPAGAAPACPLRRLEAVTLGYAAPWPCTIAITADSLRRYNEMFRFILQLKFTLRGLQALNFKDLAEASEEDWPGGPGRDGGEPAPAAAPRRLRLQLLRAWLLHFVSNIHSYIMMRVLHSTWLELEERLEKASDIDTIVQVHGRYVSVLHRRCLLAGSAERTLHAAVLSGLQLGQRLQRAWSAVGRLTEAELCQLEADYVRSHRFVTGLLRQYRQTTSHVDSLASAMAHSAPSQVPFGELD